MPEPAAQQSRPPTHRGPQRSSSGSHAIRHVRGSKSSLQAQSLHGGMDRLTRSSAGGSAPTSTTMITSNDWLGFGGDDSDDDAEEFGQDGPPNPQATNDQHRDVSRPRIQRTLSERRSIASERRPSLPREASSRGHGLSFGATQGGIGNSNEGTRHLPLRSRSDALLQNKRESMKAIYRTNPDDHKIRSSTFSQGIGGITSPSIDQTSTAASRPRPARALPPRTMSGLEAGPLLAMAAAASTPNRTKSLDSTASQTLSISTVGSSHRSCCTDTSSDDDANDLDEEDGEHAGPGSTPSTRRSIPDPKWLERRASKMEEIMALAQSVKERFEEERESKESAPNPETTGYDHKNKNGDDADDGDEDQPMAFRAKKTMLQHIAKGVQITGNGVRSLGKGTVNAIQDPKLAAKRFGHLSKDVGKATVKTAMDPKKMALGAAKSAKKVTVGSAMIGAGLTKGVAKTTFDASKAVVKGGVKATTTSAKMTMKGTKKVVKGTVRAVTGKEKVKVVKEQEYDSRHMADRNQSNLYDRISTMVGSNASSDDGSADHTQLEDAILAGIAAKNSQSSSGTSNVGLGADSAGGSSSKSRALNRPSSVLMPTNLLGPSVGGAKWDV